MSSCPLPYFPKLEHSPVLTGFFSQVSPIFLSVTGEINFITPEGCGCDKGKFGLLHNTQDFFRGNIDPAPHATTDRPEVYEFHKGETLFYR